MEDLSPEQSSPEHSSVESTAMESTMNTIILDEIWKQPSRHVADLLNLYFAEHNDQKIIWERDKENTNGEMMSKRDDDGEKKSGEKVEEVINKTKKETPKNKSKHWYSIRALLLPAIPEYPLEQARIHVAPLSSELQLCHVAVAYSQSVEHSIDLQQTVSLAVSFHDRAGVFIMYSGYSMLMAPQLLSEKEHNRRDKPLNLHILSAQILDHQGIEVHNSTWQCSGMVEDRLETKVGNNFDAILLTVRIILQISTSVQKLENHRSSLWNETVICCETFENCLLLSKQTSNCPIYGAVPNSSDNCCTSNITEHLRASRMRHESTQIQKSLSLNARTRGIGFSIPDEIPQSTILIVPIVTHFSRLLLHKFDSLISILLIQSQCRELLILRCPQPMQRDWSRDKTRQKLSSIHIIRIDWSQFEESNTISVESVHSLPISKVPLLNLVRVNDLFLWHPTIIRIILVTVSGDTSKGTVFWTEFLDFVILELSVSDDVKTELHSIHRVVRDTYSHVISIVCPASISDLPEIAEAVLYHVTTTAASARNIAPPATPS
ncbi:hypothetical protein GCK72_014918 [Caenorhabditis remanei]|uniref:Uncharacterized protein n=1 Tax=Caenorhabditis remanei TaxID=31234 RepID=A0A6A5GSQ3_CAERE|nr:hypothetical protein GCK72_014918 [Caenorhabditis remanei]KAF1758460.1 hypothetical protein GCK72_014918 [Caenorhabditis remanei]